MVGGGIGTLAAAAFLIRDGKVPAENISSSKPRRSWAEAWMAPAIPRADIVARRPHVDDRQLRMHLGSVQINSFADEPGQNGLRRNCRIQRAAQVALDGPAGRSTSRQGPGHVDGLLDARPARIAETQPRRRRNARRQPHHRLAFTPFFETEFWYMWATTFAFQPWHSAVEFKRYLHRFMLEFSRSKLWPG